MSNTRPYTLRLPIPLAARLEALSELHPQTPRAQLLVDLLALGLQAVEHARSPTRPAATSLVPDTSQRVYLLHGPFAEFHGLVHKHHLALEHELAGDDPPACRPQDDYTLGDTT